MNLSAKRWPAISSLVLCLLISFILVACGEKQTPEEQVRQFIATGIAASEDRDVIALSELISEQYGDTSRRDRRALIGLTTGYFLRHKNIHLFTQIDEITFPATDQAMVKLYVAMAVTPVTGAQALIDLRGDLYRFDLTLQNEGNEWLLQNASWQRAHIEELLGGEK